MKIAIIGIPKSGKTTLANRLAERLGYPLVHSDDQIGVGWGNQKAFTLEAIAVHGENVIAEGVTVARVLNQWNPDRVIQCYRADLASPRHAPIASRVKRAAQEWNGPFLEVSEGVDLDYLIELLGIE